MKYLALDLGTKLGWATCEGVHMGAHTIRSGTEILATPEEIQEQRAAGQDRLCDIRVLRLRKFLNEKLRESPQRPVVGFEDVLFVTTSMQAHLWASFRTVVWLVAHDNEAEKVIGVPVQTLKGYATGKGNATKDMMAAALIQKFPGGYKTVPNKRKKISPWDLVTADGRRVDDNEVDALHLLAYIVALKTS